MKPFPALDRRSLGIGELLCLASENPVFHGEWLLEPIYGLASFVALYRHEPFWMRPAYGRLERDVPADTQWLLARRSDSAYLMLAPMIDGAFRASLHGDAEGLTLHVDSGDPAVVAQAFEALYVIEGNDPHAMAEVGTREVARHLGVPLRTEKPVPKFIDSFGWCTWDAFYRGVTPKGVRDGLEAFREGGTPPGFVVLDDGWLSTRVGDHKEEILTSFQASDAFDGDLTPTVAMAKSEFGVGAFLVWHALNGYWGGADAQNFREYDVRPVVRRFAPGILRNSTPETWWTAGTFLGPVPSGVGITWLVPPRTIGGFFSDFHRSLRAQGVDGVKVDNQAAIEGLGEGCGGRVALMRRYREALEGSVHAHFGGNLINCMSCSTEMLYSARASNLVRSSDDFYPGNPETHGRHVVTNSLFGFWFGQFVLPDWDMFHSHHPAGPFHAAARALSGGPVYVSDKPGIHDFDLIRRLLVADRQTGRPLAPAMPTADCLTTDVLAGEGLMKVFAPNATNYIVGAFHCHHNPAGKRKTVSGTVCSEDVPALRGKKAVLYRDSTGLLATEPIPLSLEELQFEMVTVAEVIDGFAPIGLVRLLNPGAAILERWRDGASIYLSIAAGGEWVAYCEQSPASVRLVGVAPLRFTWQNERLTFEIPEFVRNGTVAILFDQPSGRPTASE